MRLANNVYLHELRTGLLEPIRHDLTVEGVTWTQHGALGTFNRPNQGFR